MNKRLIYAIISLIIFIGIFLAVIFGNHAFDLKISELMSNLNNYLVIPFFIFLAKYAEVIMVVITAMFLGIFISRKRKKQAWIFIAALGCGYIIEKTIKFLFERQRPNLQLISDLENSFPSGHATLAIILFSLLIYFYKDDIKDKIKRNWFIAINILLILIIGFSRLYVNLHWFSDIIAGFALGFFVLNIILFIFYKKKPNL